MTVRLIAADGATREIQVPELKVPELTPDIYTALRYPMLYAMPDYEPRFEEWRRRYAYAGAGHDGVVEYRETR